MVPLEVPSVANGIDPAKRLRLDIPPMLEGPMDATTVADRAN
jgi:hypothetical protein